MGRLLRIMRFSMMRRRLSRWCGALLLMLPSAAAGQTVERISVSASGQPGNAGSEGAAMSPDGRFILFESAASNLVPADANGVVDVFLRDRLAGTTIRVSVGSAGQESGTESFAGGVSADGTLCVFRSTATNLTDTVNSGRYLQVFLRDLVRQTTTQLSSEAGALVNGAMTASITPDGRVVVWSEDARSTIVLDRQTGVARRLDAPVGFGLGRSSLRPFGSNPYPRVAAPGAVAGSSALNLRDLYVGQGVGTGTELTIAGHTHTYTLDVGGNAAADGTLSVTVTPALDRPVPALATVALGPQDPWLRHNMLGPRRASVSASGNVVAYESGVASFDDVGQGQPSSGIFVEDLTSRRITFVSAAANGAPLSSKCEAPAISGDGAVIAFHCWGDFYAVVYVYDRATQSLSIASTNAHGRGVSLSRTGRHVTFVEDAGDESVVVLLDRETQTRTVVSRHLPETVGYRGSFRPVISDDGTVVLFTSAASNLVSGDTNRASDAFVASNGGWPCVFQMWPESLTVHRAGAGPYQLRLWTMPSCSWHAIATVPWLTVAGTGTGSGWVAVTAAPNTAGIRTASVGVGSAVVPVTQLGTSCVPALSPLSRAVSADGGLLTVTVTAPSCGWSATSNVPWITFPGAINGDTSGTLAYHVAANASGSSRAGSISVGGTVHAVTQDAAAATLHRRYLAEGATSSFFDTQVALFNPGEQAAHVTLRFLRPSEPVVVHTLILQAGARRTFNPKLLGLPVAEFSLEVISDVPVICDRTMTWDGARAYGAHAETAVEAPATTWYLAEGSTVGAFNLFYLLQNPGMTEAQVQVRYLLPSGVPLEKAYVLPPQSRTNIWVNQEEIPGRAGALRATDVSAVISSTNGQPIIVERAMYLNLPGQPFGAGHESAGVTAPATEWFLAEGATGPFFDLFVLIANPGSEAAAIEARFLLPDGTTVLRNHHVAPSSRFNIWVDQEDNLLADTAVSTTIRSTNGVPVIVERAMWWPGPSSMWHEAHNSPGSTQTGALWALAEGEVGGARNVDTYILVANTSSFVARARVTLRFEDGIETTREFEIPPQSRFNVDVRSEFPGAVGKRFGSLVEAVGAPSAELVVERAMYWSVAGQVWAAGTNALATRLR